MEQNNGTVDSNEPRTDQATHMGAPGAEARNLLDRGRDRVRSSVDDGKSRIARSLGTVASSLKDSSRQLRDGEDATVGAYVERVADQLDRAAGYLERSDVEELVQGARRFAHRNPALFLGAAFAVGVLGARFLKSSGSRISPYEGGGVSPGGVSDREVPTTRVGSADMPTGLE